MGSGYVECVLVDLDRLILMMACCCLLDDDQQEEYGEDSLAKRTEPAPSQKGCDDCGCVRRREDGWMWMDRWWMDDSERKPHQG